MLGVLEIQPHRQFVDIHRICGPTYKREEPETPSGNARRRVETTVGSENKSLSIHWNESQWWVIISTTSTNSQSLKPPKHPNLTPQMATLGLWILMIPLMGFWRAIDSCSKPSLTMVRRSTKSMFQCQTNFMAKSEILLKYWRVAWTIRNLVPSLRTGGRTCWPSSSHWDGDTKHEVQYLPWFNLTWSQLWAVDDVGGILRAYERSIWLFWIWIHLFYASPCHDARKQWYRECILQTFSTHAQSPEKDDETSWW